MANDLNIALRIRADLQSAIDQLDELENGLDDSGKAAERSADGLDRVTNAVKALGVAYFARRIFRTMLDESIRAEQAVAQLEAGLVSTNHAMGFTTDEMVRMATELRNLSTFSSSAIIEAQTRLVSYSGIVGVNFPRALQAVIDQSARLNMSLEQSAEVIGRALESPERAAAALSQQGFGAAFDAEMRATIAALVAAGREAEAQVLILEVLEESYGGAALAARNTFGGALEALQQVFGDLLATDGGLPEATQKVNELIDTLSDPRLSEATDTLASKAVRAVGLMAEVGAEVAELFTVSEMMRTGEQVTELGRLELQIRMVDRALRNSVLGTPLQLLFTSREDLETLRAQLQAEREALLAVDAVADVTGVSERPAEPPASPPPSEDFLKAHADLERRIGLLGRETAAQQLLWELEEGRYKHLEQGEKDALLATAARLDVLQAEERAGRDATRVAERRANEQKSYVQQLERQAALIGLNAEQTRAYDLSEKNLTGTLRERAAAAIALIDAEERRRRIEEDAHTVAGLQVQLLRAQGREAEAAQIEIQRRYGELTDRLRERGDAAGLEIVEGLINVEQARARLSELQRLVDQVFSDTARQEQSIQTQLQAGLLTEYEARRRIIALHQQQAAEVEKLLPEMQALAQATGDPAALDNLQRIRAELENMQYLVNDLVRAFRDGLQGGLQEAIMGLARGTHDLRDAIDSLLLGIAESMARLASQQLAEMATQGVMNLFQQGSQAAVAAAQQKAAAEVAAIQTVTAAQQASDTARAASAVAAANTTAAGQAGAAATTAASWTPAAIAASIGSFGSAAAIGLAAVVAAMAFQAFADGGHVRGPGTTTSDSIPAWLSDYEFVTRAAVVQQPGALPFLNDFNARGMAALDDWAGRVRHATGGLAGVPAPALPAPAMHTGKLAEPGGGGGATLQNSQNFYLVDDPSRIVDAAYNSRAGQDALIVTLSRDPQKFRSVLGID